MKTIKRNFEKPKNSMSLERNPLPDSKGGKIVRKKDFVEIKFTGKANGEIFDSNIPEDLKKINPESKPRKTIVIVGESMLIPGFDKALEGKETGINYTIRVGFKEGFGERKRELVKTIPLKIFTEQKINPRPGATLLLDQMPVKIITVSGARVITDFNHSLAGKDLEYTFTITRKVTNEKEKLESFFEFFLRHVPKFEIKESEIIVKGPAFLEEIIKDAEEKFKTIFNKKLIFEELKEKPK